METLEQPQIIDPSEMSFDARREMLKTQQTPTPEPKEEAAPVAEPEAKAEEPVETAPEAQQEQAEEELPRGVQKRIAQEVEKQARYQAEIDRVRFQTKALEAQLQQLKSEPGAEPEKLPNSSPKRPQLPDIETFEGTNAEFRAATAQAEQALEKWSQDQIRDRVRAEIAAEQAETARRAAWDQAVAKIGADFPKLADVVAKNSPHGFQESVSDLDNWSTVAAHLGRNPKELSDLVALHAQSPTKATIALGKLEDRLTAAVNAPPVTEKLPPPVRPQIGGSAAAKEPPSLNSAVDTGDQAAIKRLMREQGLLPARTRA
jgi:hypothetical protein